MKELYILDRNAVSLIGLFIRNGEIKDKEKMIQIGKLNELNSHNVCISLILSLYEGSFGRKIVSRGELDEILDNECKNVDLFYNKSSTDYSAISHSEMRETLYKMISEAPWEPNYQVHNEFLCEVCPLIVRDLSATDAWKVKDIILERANKLRIPLNHITVALCIAKAFGNKDVGGVLKPKLENTDYHNALGDIFSIMRFNIWKHMCIQRDPGLWKKISFFTFDKSLKRIEELLEMQISSLNFDSKFWHAEYKYKYKKDLLPKISESEFMALCQELNVIN